MINNKVISKDLRDQILSSYNYSCKVCGCTNTKLDLHHIIPRKQSGPNTLENLIPLCPSCHKKADLGPERLKDNNVKMTCLIPKYLIRRIKQHTIDYDTNITSVIINSLKEYVKKYNT